MLCLRLCRMVGVAPPPTLGFSPSFPSPAAAALFSFPNTTQARRPTAPRRAAANRPSAANGAAPPSQKPVLDAWAAAGVAPPPPFTPAAVAPLMPPVPTPATSAARSGLKGPHRLRLFSGTANPVRKG
jgi:hypothetical protein